MTNDEQNKIGEYIIDVFRHAKEIGSLKTVESKDYVAAFKLNDKQEHVILKKQLAKVYYTIKISWKNAGKPYYFERSQFIN